MQHFGYVLIVHNRTEARREAHGRMGIGNLETIDRDVLRRKMLQTDRASETLTVAMVEEIGMTGMVSRPLLKEYAPLVLEFDLY